MNSLFRFLFFVCFFFGSYLAHAADFEIRKFDVAIQVNRDGTMEVTETLDVFFFESRRGIFRNIPFRYTVREVEGEVAKGHGSLGSQYETPIENLRVEGHDFVIEASYDSKKIRIGSPDKWVKGEQQYVIKYTVYSAINFFKDHAEFYWNFTGNETTVEILEATFNVTLPASPAIDPEKSRVHTGYVGEAEANATFSYAKGVFSGQTTQTLTPNQGITGVLWIPKGVLEYTPIPLEVQASQYVIEDFHTLFEVQKDGTLLVTERMTLAVQSDLLSISRNFSPFPKGRVWNIDPRKNQGEDSARDYEFISAKSLNAGTLADLETKVSQSGETTFFELIPAAGFYEGEQPEIELKYKVWNAATNFDSSWALYTQLFGLSMFEPVRHASAEFILPEGYSATQDSFFALGNFNNTQTPLVSIEGNRILIDAFGPFGSFADVDMGILFPGVIDKVPTPARMFADNYFFNENRVEITLHSDQWVSFRHDFDMRSVTDFYHYEYDIKCRFRDNDYSTQDDWETKITQDKLFAGAYIPILRGLKTDDAQTFSYRIGDLFNLNWEFGYQDTSNYKHLWIEYKMYNLFSTVEDSSYFYFPMLNYVEEPSDLMQFKLNFPEGTDVSQVRARFWSVRDKVEYPIENFRVEGTTIIGEVSGGFREDSKIFAELVFPSSLTPSTDYVALIWLIGKNNFPLAFSFCLLIFLAILWFYVGRDKSFTKMVHFYPPEGVTSAEAGLIMDGKLDDRDVFSLLYHWGAKGYLKIEHTPKKNKAGVTYLEKLKKMPKTTPQFERTLFNQIFSNKAIEKKVKLSSLRYKLSATIIKTKSQIEKYAETHDFFVPGTRGFAKVLKGFGSFAILGAIVTGLMVQFKFGIYWWGRWDIPIAFAVAGIGLRLFGSIMPKHGSAGHQKWKHLSGFKEFIQTAEQDKLAVLVNENADYFGDTLAFAMAFGLADKWALKFKPLLDSPPNWYKGPSTTSDFSSVYLMRQMNKEMTQIKKTFTSTYSSPSSSSSSGGSSYSSSGYSSYSSSGGSSFSSSSSSSSYSGGGYGGGGVGSW